MGRKRKGMMVLGCGLLLMAGLVGSIQSRDFEEVTALPAHLLLLGTDGRFGKPQRPPVPFDHDRHTKALPGQGCDLCHRLTEKIEGKEIRVYGFPKASPPPATGEARMDAYHDACMGCHEERLGKGQAAGPVVCGDCHLASPPHGAAWEPVGFDYGIHHKHTQATESKCDLCHHIYDETERKLMYKKGAESSCQDCHARADEKNRRSFRNVAHGQCIDCHMKTHELGKKAGPRTCGGCHGARERMTVAQMAELPRIERAQKDRIVITLEGARAKEVPFDHKAHEGRARFCTECHHRTLQKCSTCHTLLGSNDGDGITLANAFHDARSRVACVGCHEVQKQEAACRGCHQFQSEGPTEDSCPVCHSGPLGPPRHPVLNRFMELLPDELVPDNVEIKVLEREYRPAKLPHGKIVRSLISSSGKSHLAEAFHARSPAICLGCHHRSVWDLETKLPGCGHCHGAIRDGKGLGRPGLLGAYHQQCMGCHEEMGIKAMGCANCHEEKPPSATATTKGQKQ